MLHRKLSGSTGYLARWGAGVWDVTAPQQTFALQDHGSSVLLAIHINELGGSRGAIDFFVHGLNANVNFADPAPDVGAWRFPFVAAAVAGTSGGGDPPPPPPPPPGPVAAPAPIAPPASLTARAARSDAVAAVKRRAGRKSRPRASACKRLAPVRMRCAVTAARGSLRWSGKATVERIAAGGEQTRVVFRGRRRDLRCERAASTAKAKARCTRSVRWEQPPIR